VLRTHLALCTLTAALCAADLPLVGKLILLEVMCLRQMVNAVLFISYGGHLRFSTVWVWYNCVLLIFSLLDNQWSCAMSGSCNCYKECLVF
jgi:hypothetical protein